MIGAFIFRLLQDKSQRPPRALPPLVERSLSWPELQSLPRDEMTPAAPSSLTPETARVTAGQACMNAALVFDRPKTSARERQLKQMDKMHAAYDEYRDRRRSLDTLLDRNKRTP